MYDQEAVSYPRSQTKLVKVARNSKFQTRKELEYAITELHRVYSFDDPKTFSESFSDYIEDLVLLLRKFPSSLRREEFTKEITLCARHLKPVDGSEELILTVNLDKIYKALRKSFLKRLVSHVRGLVKL